MNKYFALKQHEKSAKHRKMSVALCPIYSTTFFCYEKKNLGKRGFLCIHFGWKTVHRVYFKNICYSLKIVKHLYLFRFTVIIHIYKKVSHPLKRDIKYTTKLNGKMKNCCTFIFIVMEIGQGGPICFNTLLDHISS